MPSSSYSGEVKDKIHFEGAYSGEVLSQLKSQMTIQGKQTNMSKLVTRYCIVVSCLDICVLL